MDHTPRIAKKDLKHGQYYKGRCRNATIARWNESIKVFVYWRTKFGYKFLEEIRHPEDDQTFDVFVVEEECEPIEEIPI